jgi:hypothetical protein
VEAAAASSITDRPLSPAELAEQDLALDEAMGDFDLTGDDGPLPEATEPPRAPSIRT